MRNPTANHVDSCGSDIDPNVRSSASCAAVKTTLREKVRPVIVRTATDSGLQVETCIQAGKGVQGDRIFEQLANLESLKQNREGEGEGLALIEGMSASQQALELRKARDDFNTSVKR